MLMEVVLFVASLGALWMGIERVLFTRPDAGLYLILGAVLLIGAAILSRLRYDQKQQQRRQSCATAERRKPITPTRAWGAREMMTALQREDRGEAGAASGAARRRGIGDDA